MNDNLEGVGFTGVVERFDGEIDLSKLFDGNLVIIDEPIRNFLGLSKTLEVRDLPARKFKNERSFSHEAYEVFDRWSLHPSFPTEAQVFSLLLKLDKQRSVLAIPIATEQEKKKKKKYNEMNLYLGIIIYQGNFYIIYLEHEKEPGKNEEWHFHAKNFNPFVEKISRDRRFLKITTL